MTVLAAGVVVLGGCGSDDEATGPNAGNPASASPPAETANAVLTKAASVMCSAWLAQAALNIAATGSMS